jgi:hypothetical protein
VAVRVASTDSNDIMNFEAQKNAKGVKNCETVTIKNKIIILTMYYG